MREVAARDATTLVALTGASGFVGRHVLRRLTSTGANVRAIARSPQSIERSDRASVHAVSEYTDASALVPLFEGCDAVIHLAARAHRLDEDPSTAGRAFEVANVEAARAVAQAARVAGVPRVVLVSSIGVLGERTAGTPLSDASVPDPVGPYAVSKWHGELAVSDALAGSATQWVVLRPPLVYGPGAPGNFGSLLRLVRRAPIVPLGGLHRRRSFIAVANLCDALAVAAAHPGAANRRFTLSDDDDVSVAEVARALAAGFGRHPRCVVDVPESLLRAVAAVAGRRSTFEKLAAELIVDASGFRAATGWKPSWRAAEALRAAAAVECAEAIIERA